MGREEGGSGGDLCGGDTKAQQRVTQEVMREEPQIAVAIGKPQAVLRDRSGERRQAGQGGKEEVEMF